MAGTGRTTAIACALLALLWSGGGSAATVITGPGTPETLLHDAHLTVASSRAIHRSVPPPPARADFVARATVVTAYAGCVAAGTGAASAVGSSVGYLWLAARCLHRDRRPATDPPSAIAHLFLPPPPAPFWSPRGAPVRLPAPGGGAGARPHVAPVPLPLPGMALPAALGLLLLFRRRRR